MKFILSVESGTSIDIEVPKEELMSLDINIMIRYFAPSFRLLLWKVRDEMDKA